MPEKIARVQATIYVTTHLSIALAAAAAAQTKTTLRFSHKIQHTR